MEDVLKYGLNRLRDSLYANEKTRTAFISIAEVIRDASDLIVKLTNKEPAGGGSCNAKRSVDECITLGLEE